MAVWPDSLWTVELSANHVKCKSLTLTPEGHIVRAHRLPDPAGEHFVGPHSHGTRKEYFTHVAKNCVYHLQLRRPCADHRSLNHYRVGSSLTRRSVARSNGRRRP